MVMTMPEVLAHSTIKHEHCASLQKMNHKCIVTVVSGFIRQVGRITTDTSGRYNDCFHIDK